jgi:hypothetical protein
MARPRKTNRTTRKTRTNRAKKTGGKKSKKVKTNKKAKLISNKLRIGRGIAYTALGAGTLAAIYKLLKYPKKVTKVNKPETIQISPRPSLRSESSNLYFAPFENDPNKIINDLLRAENIMSHHPSYAAYPKDPAHGEVLSESRFAKYVPDFIY